MKSAYDFGVCGGDENFGTTPSEGGVYRKHGRIFASCANRGSSHAYHPSPSDWYTSEGDGWYAWLLPRLAQDANILPCFLYTPPSLGVVPKFSSPPQTPKSYADFIDVMITRFGDYFDWVELWNRPNDPNEWDTRIDPDWESFSTMIGGAAYWARSRGKKTVLPGTWPIDLNWL